MRIWFNHWFSTAYNLITELKKGCIENNIDIQIIGSNRLNSCVYKVLCDEFYTEPIEISDDNYVKWCIDFCKEHHIDVFIPRRERSSISKYLSECEQMNVKVMVDDNSELIDKCSNQPWFSSFFTTS